MPWHRHRPELVELGGMIWPAALSSICFSLMEVVDTAMLGMVGVHAMAGTGLAVTFIYLVMALPMYLIRAAAPLASASLSRGAVCRIRSLIRLTVTTALLLGVAATAVVLAAAQVLPRLGYDPQLVSAAQSYLAWRAPFLAVELAFFGGWALLEGLTSTRTPLVAGLACNATNVVLNLLLIPGLGGLPALGAKGAALATNVSMIVGLAWLAVATNRALQRRLGCTLASALSAWREIDREVARRFLRIGWPLGVAGLLDTSGWLVIGLVIPRLGTTAAAAHAIVSQLITLGLATAHGSGIAAVILVARALGGGDRHLARRRARGLLRLQAALGGAIGVVALAAGARWISLFSSDAQVSCAAAALLPLAVAIIALEGLAICASGVVEGTGRTRVLLASTVLFDIVLGLVVAVALVPRGGLVSLYGIWAAKDLLKVIVLFVLSRRCVARTAQVSDLCWPTARTMNRAAGPVPLPWRARRAGRQRPGTSPLLELTWWLVPDG